MTLEKFLWSKSEPRKSLYCHLYEAAVVMRILLTKSIYSSDILTLDAESGKFIVSEYDGDTRACRNEFIPSVQLMSANIFFDAFNLRLHCLSY